MNDLFEINEKARAWLQQSALPLWSKAGFDSTTHQFEESLTLEGQPTGENRRSMVQARQIYSFRVAHEMGFISLLDLEKTVEAAAHQLIEKYQISSGAILHSIRVDGSTADTRPDLYSQAFAIFGLAHAFAKTGNPVFKSAATRVLRYLKAERRLPEGGFSEIGLNGEIQLVSNPHMHLFEATLAWLEIENDPQWRELADELVEMAITRFVDGSRGFLGEFFDAGWTLQTLGGRFMFEPGHQYEWSWLIERYQKITDAPLSKTCDSLFEKSEDCGVDRQTGVIYDQVWSDCTPKLLSSRFWPHTERIKAASLRVLNGKGDPKPACDSMKMLLRYFDLPTKGLWYDVMNSDGTFKKQNAKGSSLYHIIGAIFEFDRMAEKLSKC